VQSFDEMLRARQAISQELHHREERDFSHKNQQIAADFYLMDGCRPVIPWPFDKIRQPDFFHATTR
jgi:hypothetical protein